MPHDDVRVGRLNVCNEVRSRRQPIQRGRHNHRPGGDITGSGNGPAIGIERGLSRHLFAAPLKAGAVNPEAVKQNRDLASNRHFRLFHTYPL